MSIHFLSRQIPGSKEDTEIYGTERTDAECKTVAVTPKRPLPSPRDAADVMMILFRVARAMAGGAPTRGTMCLAVNRSGEVLLIRSSYRRQWALPGGFLLDDEDPVAGGVRELLEETGATLQHAELVIEQRRRTHHDHLVVGVVDPVEPFTSTWEIRSADWVPAWEIDSRHGPLHPFSQNMLRQLPDGTETFIASFIERHFRT